MTRSLPHSPAQNASRDCDLDLRSEKIADAIRTLLSALPLDEQDKILQELSRKLRVIPAHRAGDVLGTIVRLLPLRKDWTIEDIKNGVVNRGIEAKPKDIYNAIGYLTRKRKIKRVGRGRYIVDGMPIVSADDFGGERSITEGDLDD